MYGGLVIDSRDCVDNNNCEKVNFAMNALILKNATTAHFASYVKTALNVCFAMTAQAV